MANVWRQRPRYSNGCPECGHGGHSAGQCKQCNCGQSERVDFHGHGFMAPNLTLTGSHPTNLRASGGRHIGPMKNAD